MKITKDLQGFRKSSFDYIYAQENSVIGRQCVAVFVYSSVLLILGVILNLCGIAGPVSPFFQIANISQAALVALGLYLYYNRRISLTTAMSLYCIVLQVEISTETIYCALNQTSHDIALILANVALSAVVLLLGIISYLRIIPLIVALLSLGTYGISVYITGSEELGNFFIVFLVIFTALILMGGTMTSNISRLDKENTELKDEKKKMHDVFQMTNEEMDSYMMLAREKKLEPEKTAEILTTVGDVAEKRILDNVAHYMRQCSIDYDNLHDQFPELSRSELEICSLILKEKTVKMIGQILGKSHSNITCQRSNIRTKLKLEKKDNLLEALRRRLAICQM